MQTSVKDVPKARNLRLKHDHAKRVLIEVFSGESIDFEAARMVLNEYKSREGREFDAELASHVERCAESAQRPGLDARGAIQWTLQGISKRWTPGCVI